jgi:BirA family biotin operon repressor/biotin-[acetyl-CoA-carboxylase] ligase
MMARRNSAVVGELHPARLLYLFGRTRFARTVVLIDRCESTNTAANDAAARGASEGVVLVTEEQLAGRGRKGRQWFSIPGKSLTFSIILRPRRSGEGITALMGLSVAQALDEVCAGIDVKWPNDLYLGGRKLGGILAEKRENYIVIGVGLNVNEEVDDFTGALLEEAVSLRMHTGERLDRGAVLAYILGRFEVGYGEWTQSGFGPFRRALEERLLYRGERVLLDCGGEMIEGTVLGLTDEAYLRCDIDGRERVVASGDVTVSR